MKTNAVFPARGFCGSVFQDTIHSQVVIMLRGRIGLRKHIHCVEGKSLFSKFIILLQNIELNNVSYFEKINLLK